MTNPTAYDITDDQIRQLRSLDLCSVCNCGLLAPEHHNEFLHGHHAFRSIGRQAFDAALTACVTCKGSGKHPGWHCCSTCLGEGYEREARLAREHLAALWGRWQAGRTDGDLP